MNLRPFVLALSTWSAPSPNGFSEAMRLGAFRALEDLGLVQIEQNRGAFVRKINLDEAVEIHVPSSSNSVPRVWFITGASRGLGAEIARSALEAGDIVVGTGRHAEDVTRNLGASDHLLAVSLDVTDPHSVLVAVKATIARYGRVDVLVNSAGFGLLGGVEGASAEEVERVFQTNVFGLLNVTRAVLPHMRSRRAGHLINLSSIGGYESHIGWGIYCATKFAVEALSEALSAELAPLGIYSTVVEPGFFCTDFLDDKSLHRTQKVIEDYAETVGAMRSFAAGRNHQQPNDPAKLGPAVLAVVSAERPPVRLPLGRDTVEIIEKKKLSSPENSTNGVTSPNRPLSKPWNCKRLAESNLENKRRT